MLFAVVSSLLLPLALHSVIVIDPGHGGFQPGTKAGKGRFEKELTLRVSKIVKAELVRRGHQVFLTRDDDRYLALGARSRFANTKSADVMISIHANESGNAQAAGIETYFLAAKASDAEAQALAEKENEDVSETNNDQALLENILTDLRRSNASIEAELLAARVQGALIKATDTKNRGVKRAPLAVLKRTDMAAVLVEIGFVTNPHENDNLWSGAYEEKLAAGIANGVDHFLGDVEHNLVPEVPPVSEAPLVSLQHPPPHKDVALLRYEHRSHAQIWHPLHALKHAGKKVRQAWRRKFRHPHHRNASHTA